MADDWYDEYKKNQAWIALATGTKPNDPMVAREMGLMFGEVGAWVAEPLVKPPQPVSPPIAPEQARKPHTPAIQHANKTYTHSRTSHLSPKRALDRRIVLPPPQPARQHKRRQAFWAAFKWTTIVTIALPFIIIPTRNILSGGSIRQILSDLLQPILVTHLYMSVVIGLIAGLICYAVRSFK